MQLALGVVCSDFNFYVGMFTNSRSVTVLMGEDLGESDGRANGSRRSKVPG